MSQQSAHRYEDQLLELAYGELPAAEARSIEAHLEGCARCTGALREIEGVRRQMSQLAPEPPPEVGLESLLAYAGQAARRAQVGPAPARGIRRWVFGLAGAASLAAVLVVVGLVANRASSDLRGIPAVSRPAPAATAEPAPAPVSAPSPPGYAGELARKETETRQEVLGQGEEPKLDTSSGQGAGPPRKSAPLSSEGLASYPVESKTGGRVDKGGEVPSEANAVEAVSRQLAEKTRDEISKDAPPQPVAEAKPAPAPAPVSAPSTAPPVAASPLPPGKGDLGAAQELYAAANRAPTGSGEEIDALVDALAAGLSGRDRLTALERLCTRLEDRNDARALDYCAAWANADPGSAVASRRAREARLRWSEQKKVKAKQNEAAQPAQAY